MTETRIQLKHVASGRIVDVSGAMRIGRNPDSDLVLTEGNPSRRHAELRVQDGGIWLEDVGSANGTFVNGAEISAATKLNNGDRIAFDAEQYQVIVEEPVDPNATVVIRRDPAPAADSAPIADSAPADSAPADSAPAEPQADASAASATPSASAASDSSTPTPGPAESAVPPEQHPAKPAKQNAEQTADVAPSAAPAEPAPATDPANNAPARAEDESPTEPAAQDATADAAAEQPQTPPSEAVVKAKSDSAHRPGSWADPEKQNAQGTRLFNPDELKKFGAGAPAGDAVSGAVDMPYLQIASGSKAGSGLKLQPGGDANQWSIGSDEERDIALQDDGISGLHAKIVNEGARWKLIDQMSANGTFVNGQKSNVSFLRDGDRLRFGPVECVFRLPVGSKPQDTATGDQPRSWVIGAVSFAVTVVVLAVAYWLLG